MTLLTLVPRLPPLVDGVGDYADRLAQEIAHQTRAHQTRITSQFLIADPHWAADSTSPPHAQALTARSTTQLLNHLTATQPRAILLHYVPHGYARKACPLWLLRGLSTWKKHAATPLITMFHELYACDWRRPWSSDFWLSPIQRAIAIQLAQTSDHCLTSTEKYARFLTAHRSPHRAPVPSLPVFSNIGEPSQILPIAQRQRRLILFGQRHSKQTIYQRALPELAKVCQALAIAEIWDLGPSSQIAPSQIGTVPLRELGPCSPENLATILSTSLAGFLAYDPDRLAKSGIFAAYCAYGLLPINYTGKNIRIDGLKAGEQYITPDLLQSPLNTATVLPECQQQRLADQAQQWYQQHRLAVHASQVHQLLHLSDQYANAR